MSAPLVTPSRDALAKALHEIPVVWETETQKAVKFMLDRDDAEFIADHLIASGAVIDAATLTDDETVRAVAYRFAEAKATYAASTVRHVLRALVDVLAERGEQHG